MRKQESIMKMEALDLNTLDYFITGDEAEATHYFAKHLQDRLSLRTQRGKEFQCPFYYMTLGKDLLNIALGHLREGYTLILAPSLDTVGCLAFGTIMFRGDQGDTIEFVMGEGKVRELDNHPKRQTHYVEMASLIPVRERDTSRLTSEQVTMLNRIFKTIKEAIYESIPCIVEWSYYDRPVGKLGRKLILWELRDA